MRFFSYKILIVEKMFFWKEKICSYPQHLVLYYMLFPIIPQEGQIWQKIFKK